MSKAQDLLARSSKNCVTEFLKHGNVDPKFIFELEDGTRVLMGFPDFLHGLTNDRNLNKEKVAQIVRKGLKEMQAVRYAFESEAWMVDGTKMPDGGESAVKMSEQGDSLEGHPDRVEAIAVFVEDRDTKEKLQRNYQILRPEYGKARLGPPKNIDMAEAYGRFVGLFEEET